MRLRSFFFARVESVVHAVLALDLLCILLSSAFVKVTIRFCTIRNIFLFVSLCVPSFSLRGIPENHPFLIDIFNTPLRGEI